MSYPTEAEQEAFTAGWNAAMENAEELLREANAGFLETLGLRDEEAIEAWIREREKAPGRV